MAIPVAWDDVFTVMVQNDAQVEVRPSRPEARVPGPVYAVQAEARVGDVGLQGKGRGLRRPLLLVGEPGEAGGESVSYAELHVSTAS